MFQLTLFRHGKAVREHEAPGDHDRALVERGWREVEEAARWLHGWGVLPTRVLVSDALRTQQTWAAVQGVWAGPDAPTVDHRPDLYLAEPEEIWAQVLAEQTTQSLLVIGHNPGLHQLALWLMAEGGSADDLATRHLREGLPTSGAVVFEAAPDTTRLHPAAFRLKAFCAPRV
jgi:phosphohistidine phosphatase